MASLTCKKCGKIYSQDIDPDFLICTKCLKDLEKTIPKAPVIITRVGRWELN